MKRYLELCRFPAVFTAAADVLLGFVLAATAVGGLGDGPAGPTAALAWAVAASAGLYLGGMVLNGILDREQDAAERPGRPIPSGRVSSTSAWRFYAALTLGGLAFAAAAGPACVAVAAAVAACVWLYDGPLKRTPAGPAMMGLCRFGNVLIGAAAGADGADEALSDPRLLGAAALLGAYVTGPTLFARTEAKTSRRRPLVAGSLLVNAALAGVIAWGVLYGRPWPLALAAVGATAVVINRRLAAAVREPAPPRVGAAVRTMILAVPVVDACLIALLAGPGAWLWAAACGLLAVPAATAGRVLKLT